ncbi:type II secretion system F family protein [Desulfovibrio sp. JC022]|uniref:type II secretion system F family protein n=1 Tax=Desulfovibrio sp. JC022 TaxID=2593642 RepID=UPI0013D831BD|nr:type II secretion system F family protein [Desulfovibrio sp. JC022]NDV24922.1 type II secretion protein F [Desulfovibrio sp. JC022]
MSAFQYKAVSSAGKSVKGIIEADNKAAALTSLKEKGLYPTKLSRVRERRGNGGGSSFRLLYQKIFRRVSPKVLAGSVRQLATLLTAGMALDVALAAMLEGRGASELDKVLSEIRERVREGMSLAEAMAEHKHVFSTTFVTMVEAGENSGSLDLVLGRLADHLEAQVALRRKVQSALAYPILMLLVGGGIFIFLMMFIVPKVTQIFIDMKQQLPLPTRILISFSDFMGQWWHVMLLSLIGLVVIGVKFKKTARGKRFFDKLKFSLPVMGNLSRYIEVGNFTRTLGLLLRNDVNLLKGLGIVRSASSNFYLERVVDQITEDVQEGKDLALAMRGSFLFDPTHVQLISAGERSGQLDRMFLIVADDCDDEVDSKLQMLTSLIEPLMILSLGVIVGFVVVSIIMPIFQMNSLVG